ncbi:MAG: type VI secretion system transmembrane protein TssQ [Rikenellaceae bacterium]|nr:type VI secretion system transmembrane protein TssQ [Rikenellaceae bacterium]
MNAKNSREVTKGYLWFTFAMCASILTGMVSLWCFLTTAGKEMEYINLRSGEYDAAFSNQIMLTEKVDSLYNNLTLLNSGQLVNQTVLYNRISNQKMNLLRVLEELADNDAVLYKSLSDNINDVLQVKDSIRLLDSQVELVKGDLQRCILDNRAATRRMFSTGN